MKSLMDDAGLPWNTERSMTYNSRLAQELAAWSDTLESDFHMRLYKAYFLDNLNIADTSILLQLVSDAGLNTEEAELVLTTRSFAPMIDEEWKHARLSGITAVPTFSSRDLYVTGCQPYEILVRFVDHLRSLS